MALTIFFCVLLVDAAVETFLSGAQVRWWVVGVVGAYLGLTSLLVWRGGSLRERFGWSTRARVSVLVLLGLLAATAWMPEGLTNGTAMLRQPTSVVLSAVTAAAVVFAGIVLVRVTFVPWWSRAALGLLALYGVAAFVLGIIADTSYPSLFHGDSLWRRLPYWLQGASIGAFVTIPLAIALRVVDAFKRLRYVDARNRRLQQSVALGFSVLIAVSGFTIDASPLSTPAATSAIGGSRYRGPGMGVQTNSSLALPVPRTLELTHVEPVHFAAALGRDPVRMFEYIRDHIGYEAYSGRLRGPRGTLLALSGNSLDRASLLADLLQQAGLQVRFARGTLHEAAAMALITSMWARPNPSAEAPLSDTGAARLEEALVSSVKSNYLLIREKLAKARITGGASSPSLEALMAEAKAHYWVQAWKDGRWIDFDPSFGDAVVGSTYTQAEQTLTSLPDELLHRLTVRVRVEEYADGTPSTREVLSYTTQAPEVSGRDIFLLHLPPEWSGPTGKKDDSEATAEPPLLLKPVLFVGREIVQGQAFRHYLDRGVGGRVKSLLSRATARDEAVATAEWLEFEITPPEGKRETVVRDIYDVVGPARRTAGHRLTSEQVKEAMNGTRVDVRTSIYGVFVTGGRIDPLHLPPPEGASTPDTLTEEDAIVLMRSASVAAIASADALVWRLSAVDGRILFYPDSLRFHIVELWVHEDGKHLSVGLSLDLRRDYVRVVAEGSRSEDVFYGRVLRGVVSGTLEKILIERLLEGRSQQERPLVSTSRLLERAQADGAQVLLLPTEMDRLDPNVPENARARVRDETSRGMLAVAPRQGTLIGNTQRFAWWRIDPRSGETVGVTDDGLHQTGTERTTVQSQKVEFTVARGPLGSWDVHVTQKGYGFSRWFGGPARFNGGSMFTFPMKSFFRTIWILLKGGARFRGFGVPSYIPI